MATATATRSRTPEHTGPFTTSRAAVDRAAACRCGQPLDAWHSPSCSRCGVRVAVRLLGDPADRP